MSMIGVDYGVLNQRGSPSWFSDVYANIPTAGYKGRMFISTDTFAFYRDTGTGWDLIGGPGIGTLTGSGVTGQVSFFNGTQVLTGSNNLFWDNTNGRLGIGTATPSAPLDIHATGTNATFNGTGTNNAYLQFQNAGVSKWRIGNTYSAGANSYAIFNNGLGNLALSVNSTNNAMTTTGYLLIDNGLANTQIYLPRSSGDVYGTIQTESGGSLFSLGVTSLTLPALGTPVITWTSGLQVGINTLSPTKDFDVNGTAKVRGIFTLGSTLSNGTYFYTLPSATGTLALTSDITSAISGTTNRLSKFTSANVIGNSMVSDDGTTLTSTGATRSNLYIKAINNTYYSQLAFANGTNALTGGISYNNSGQYMQFETNTSEWMRLTSDGKLGIVRLSPEFILDVNGDIALNRTNKLQFSGPVAGDRQRSYITGDGNNNIFIYGPSNNIITAFGYTGGVTITTLAGTGSRAVLADASGNLSAPVSDISVKQNIKIIGYGLNEIIKMNPVWFDFIDEYKNYGNGRQNGNIAQEMEKIIPEAVFTTPSNNKMGINYDQLHAVYIKAIQELNEKLIRNNIN